MAPIQFNPGHFHGQITDIPPIDPLPPIPYLGLPRRYFQRSLFDGTELSVNTGDMKIVSVTDHSDYAHRFYYDRFDDQFLEGPRYREIKVEIEAGSHVGTFANHTQMNREIINAEVQNLVATALNQAIILTTTPSTMTVTNTNVTNITSLTSTNETIRFNIEASVRLNYIQESSFYWTEEQKKQRFQEKIRSELKNNLLIKISKKTGRDCLPPITASPEQKARETLREMITESEWRRYLTNGFIMVKAPSGLWYQIFNRYSERLRVFKDGQQIESICIHSDQSCPPTDHVISMKIMIELDEETVRKGGNLVKTNPAVRDQIRAAIRNHLNSHEAPVVNEETNLEELDRMVQERIIDPAYADLLRKRLGYKKGVIKPQPSRLLQVYEEEKLRTA